MPTIKFVYGKNVLDIAGTHLDKDTIDDAIKKYRRFMHGEDLLFWYRGINILENKEKLNELRKNDNIIITVIKKNKNKNKTENDIRNIICPECKKLAFFSINEDGIIKLDKCINKHKNEYSLNEFIENQEIKENEIICDICKNNKAIYNDNFYVCSCNKKICQLCMINHSKNKEHNLLYYNKIYSNCKKHLIEYVSYCSQCNINLCEKCEKEHHNHKNKIILFKKEKLEDKKKKEIII